MLWRMNKKGVAVSSGKVFGYMSREAVISSVQKLDEVCEMFGGD